MIGADLAFARLFLSLVFGISIGMIMALIFRRSDISHDQSPDTMFAGKATIKKASLAFLLILVALLLSGTLKIGLLTNAYGGVKIPVSGLDRFQEFLSRVVPSDSATGQEGVSVQGAILIGLLFLIAFVSWRGLGKISDGFNRWTWVSLGPGRPHAPGRFGRDDGARRGIWTSCSLARCSGSSFPWRCWHISGIGD